MVTTKDCKEFLSMQFSTQQNSWKRVSKRKVGESIHRVFYNSHFGNITVVEYNNQLTMENIKIDVAVLETYIQKIFPREEMDGAIELIKLYKKAIALDDKNNDTNISNVKALMNTEQWLKYKHAIPSQFSFTFEEYEEYVYKKYVTKGLKTEMLPKDKWGGFCVTFKTKYNYSKDYELHDLLLESGILPDWVMSADEHYTMLNKPPTDITVGEYIQYLLSLGFNYNSRGCLFSSDMKNVVIIKQ